ncbi:hypothetical protein BDZ97DRAFT_1917812 [Flammula alnicola]|nr:hypothetical protein BDZ97DRAFT_1917812 [Flammula alnicola]
MIISKNSVYVKVIVIFISAAFLYSVFGFSKRSQSALGARIGAEAAFQSIGYTLAPSRITKYFPPLDPQRRDYHEWNAQSLRELHICLAIENCGPNQQKVALLAAHWFEEAVVRSWRGGEGVWALSVYKNLRALGYTTLFANSFDEALQQWSFAIKAGECHQDPKCVKGPTNPTGIPAWKIFDFEFFASHGGHFHASLMKGKWILSANPDPRVQSEDESPIQYIGYSIEEDCQKIPPVRLADRSRQIWMLMKQLTYVYNDNFAWNRSYFALASEELGMNFVGGWQVDQHYGGWNPDLKGLMTDIEDRDHGVINFGRLDQTEFTRQVRMSRVMIGVGSPWWSPSPYNALCQGVPFINPILRWNTKDPWDKSSWYTQHPSLNQFEPPFIYNVHAKDWDGFIEAIKTASRTEIPSFIPNHMTERAVQERLRRLMETDWKSKAAILLEERLADAKSGQKAYVFEL